MSAPSPQFAFNPLPARLPQGYAAAALGTDTSARLSVIIKTDAKPGHSPLVLLRDTMDARVYLGCIADSAGWIHSYLEIWVQDASGLGTASPAYRNALNNASLDARWADRCRGFEAAGAVFHTGWETEHPDPILLDAKTLKPVPARDARTGAHWVLCRDEDLLLKKSAPGYAATLSRHLYQPELGDATELLPVDLIGSDGAAVGKALGAPGDVVALNPGGGLMMVVPHAPLAYEHFVDAISGANAEAGPADTLLRTIASAALSGDGNSPSKVGGWLGLRGVGIAGRLVEALHLKLMLLAGAIAQVRDQTTLTRSPLLNLSAESFRVALAARAPALPLWWTARALLCAPGDATELEIAGTSAKYFLPSRSGGMSIYSPAGMGAAASGRGWLRLRSVNTESGGAILEGTLSTQDRVTAGGNDLLWLRVQAGGARMDLHAVVDATSAMAAGEIRLRTLPTKLPDAGLAHLRSALGVPIPDVTFELVPLLSTPCDLYALGVLAVRTLLVDSRRPLPVALDELMSLAMQAARAIDSGQDLPGRIAAAFDADKRFPDALGPQRLLNDAGNADEAFAAIPPRLWFGVLACIIRLFTGLSQDSRCKDFGDCPAGAPHRVFDGPLEDLYALLGACRALIVPDQALSSEVRGVLKECLASAKR
ncbi:MAG: hypothetical protein JSR77_03930 [Planctomycetes bacterium]|nr:hypothetical protein [Planctomycetota bacterium]